MRAPAYCVPAGAGQHHGLLYRRRRDGQDDLLPPLDGIEAGRGIITVMTNLAEKVDEEAEEELYDAFTELGDDPGLSDAAFAFQAQAEVALRD